MKLNLILCFIIIQTCLHAQSVQTHHGIGRVDGDGPSQPYLARTAYVLRWHVDPKYKLYGKQDPTVKVESYVAGLTVRDVDTGRVVHSLSRIPLDGETKVPVAGKHTVELFSTAPWQASYVEDKELLESAARRGVLKPGQTITESDRHSTDRRQERIEVAKNQLLGEVARQRSDMGDAVADQAVMEIHRCAKIASDDVDFYKRAAAAFRLMKTDIRPAATNPVSSDVPRSTWDGQGMPPGMQPVK